MKSLFRNEVMTLSVEPDPTGGFKLRVFVHLLPEADLGAVLAELLPESVTLGTTFHIGEDLGGRAPRRRRRYRGQGQRVRRRKRPAVRRRGVVRRAV